MDHWSRDMLNFGFLEKGLGIVSPPHFVNDFSRNMFLMLYSINWTNFIFRLLLLLEIIGNICIAIICFPGCDVIDFEINLIFLIKPFFYMTKETKQKFEELSVGKNCIRPESASLQQILHINLWSQLLTWSKPLPFETALI